MKPSCCLRWHDVVARFVLATCFATGPALGPTHALAAARADAKADPGKTLADEAAALFKDGKYLQAAELFERAFALAPDRIVRLRNAGRAFEEAGRLEHARHLFQRYVELAKPGTDRSEVRERLARLEARLAATKAPVAAETPAKVADTPRSAAETAAASPGVSATTTPGSPPPVRYAAWGVAAAGAGLAASGFLWLGAVANAQARFDADVAAHRYTYPGGGKKRGEDESTLATNETVAWTLLATGTAALAGGLVWAFWPREAAVAVLPTERGALLAVRF